MAKETEFTISSRCNSQLSAEFTSSVTRQLPGPNRDLLYFSSDKDNEASLLLG